MSRVDGTLSDWAASEGLDVAPATIRRWRLAGLLPRATEISTGSAPGRPARTYTAEETTTAKKLVQFYSLHSRRGLSAHELALIAFGYGQPVPHDGVLAGLRDVFDRLQRDVAKLRQQAASAVLSIPSDLRVPDGFDEAEELARLALDQDLEIVRRARTGLRRSDAGDDGVDLQGVLVAIFGPMIGYIPARDDLPLFDALLHALGAHGMVERPRYDVEPLAAEGAIAVLPALEFLNSMKAFCVPVDLRPEELVEAREVIHSLTAALAAAPEEVRHFLGGNGMLELWLPDDPTVVAVVLLALVELNRRGVVDVGPLIFAVRAQGWLG